jgi:fatty-acyl-CoA synthase
MVSLSACVTHSARSRPSAEAIVYAGHRITYAQLRDRVHRGAALLRKRLIQPGQVVALLMKNSAAYIELAFASSHVGAVLLPINYRLSAEEVGYILEHSRASLLFIDDEFLPTADGFANVIVVDSSAQANSALLLQGDDGVASQEAHPSRPQDLFRLMHTYDNFMWKCLDHITTLGLSMSDRLLVVGPLYHVGAFDLPGMAVLLCGGTLVVQREFNPREALELIASERLTGGWMAPAMLNRCLAAEGPSLPLDSLKWLVGGGERTPEERIREFSGLFTHARYIDAYGLTETCSGDTFMEAGQEIAKIGSTGRGRARRAQHQGRRRNGAGPWYPG